MLFKNKDELTKLIDHTLLNPDAIKSDIERLCEESIKYNFFSVCINPWWIKLVKEKLKDTNIKTCSVIGFPLGMSNAKSEEANKALSLGADELDMVIAIGALKSRQYDEVKKDIDNIVSFKKPVKVILETCLLTEEEITKACHICLDSGAAFIKTSTGFSKEGAKADIIQLIKNEVKDKIGIKASGGIRDLDKFMMMINAGATRIGSSNSINIVEQYIKGDSR